MRLRKTMIGFGRGLAIVTLLLGMLASAFVAFAAQGGTSGTQAASQSNGNGAITGNGSKSTGMSVSGTWSVTLTSGKFAGKHGTAVLVQGNGSSVDATLTDGNHSAQGHGTNIAGAVSVRGDYQLFANTPVATTIYHASAVAQLSADGKTLTGTWADSLGDTGSFTATRS